MSAGCILLCASSYSATEAEAALYSSGVINEPIPDAAAVGSPGYASSTISIFDNLIIDSMTVTLDISHEWVGDLEIALFRDDGDATTADPFIFLVHNDGNPNTNPNVFRAGELYTFSDTATSYMERSQIPYPWTIPGGTYLPDDSRIILPSSRNGTFDSLFGGLSSQADWVLHIYDGFPGPTDPSLPETLISWEIDIQEAAVPVPGAVWLLASGLVGLAALKKRRLS